MHVGHAFADQSNRVGTKDQRGVGRCGFVAIATARAEELPARCPQTPRFEGILDVLRRRSGNLRESQERGMDDPGNARVHRFRTVGTAGVGQQQGLPQAASNRVDAPREVLPQQDSRPRPDPSRIHDQSEGLLGPTRELRRRSDQFQGLPLLGALRITGKLGRIGYLGGTVEASERDVQMLGGVQIHGRQRRRMGVRRRNVFVPKARPDGREEPSVRIVHDLERRHRPVGDQDQPEVITVLAGEDVRDQGIGLEDRGRTVSWLARCGRRPGIRFGVVVVRHRRRSWSRNR
mmetsp:Transcript_27715/g.65102  ORF Transcript_27715/g.65102 Transcript_27715/m.65102 type:complete len:290 (+) Transcript_27715:1956-2825(+)